MGLEWVSWDFRIRLRRDNCECVWGCGQCFRGAMRVLERVVLCASLRM